MTNERETLKVTEPQDTHTIGLLKTGIPETLRRWRDSDDNSLLKVLNYHPDYQFQAYLKGMQHWLLKREWKTVK